LERRPACGEAAEEPARPCPPFASQGERFTRPLIPAISGAQPAWPRQCNADERRSASRPGEGHEMTTSSRAAAVALLASAAACAQAPRQEVRELVSAVQGEEAGLPCREPSITSHRRAIDVGERVPVHVTVRVREHVWNLRSIAQSSHE